MTCKDGACKLHTKLPSDFATDHHHSWDTVLNEPDFEMCCSPTTTTAHCEHSRLELHTHAMMTLSQTLLYMSVTQRTWKNAHLAGPE